MSESDGNSRIVGLILLVVGGGSLALNLSEGYGQAVVLLLFGAAFLAVYFYRRIYGFLIPACVLLGLALGIVGSEAGFPFGHPVFIGLGLGFLAIYAVARICEGDSHWWPLIPGFIFIFVNLVLELPKLVTYLIEKPDILRWFEIGWPAILILIGLYFLASSFGTAEQEAPDEVTEEVSASDK